MDENQERKAAACSHTVTSPELLMCQNRKILLFLPPYLCSGNLTISISSRVPLGTKTLLVIGLRLSVTCKRVLFNFERGKNQCWTHTSMSYQVCTLSPVSSWAPQTTTCHGESRRLACFSLQNPQIKPQLPKAPAGKVCLCKRQGWGSTLLFLTKLCSLYYWGNLALNQGRRRSTSWLLITKEMLTYFQRSEKEMLRAAVATCETLPTKLRRRRILRWKSQSWGRNQIAEWMQIAFKT